ncbi:amidase domain-containing protein [Clostridium botulinum]|uniref:amidase domain-containing protein n=1 Tax=Clostridium botulinum TaxID=1491 RepID=UPI0017482E35|nr:amidase domain-containing protein [Clostridium botulinum]MBD5640740.1 amidase domain-containing protein [Clostridium botulinum]
MNWRIKKQNRYLREKAVAYATTYALNPNPKYRYLPIVNNSSGDCTNFISQCLLAGGAPMNFNSEYPWWYKHNNTINVMDDTWSICWAVAHSLYYYLKVNQEKGSFGAKGLEVYNKNELNIGDLVFFEDNNNRIFHSTIITSFQGKEPLISQHTFNDLNIPIKTSWKYIKPHFLKISL